MILKNKLKLRSSNNPSPVRNVFITPDYTPLEQKKNKALRQQLADMNKVENVYTIKNGKIARRYGKPFVSKIRPYDPTLINYTTIVL